MIVAKEIPLVKKLIETGYTGRKGKGGFYRINKNSGVPKLWKQLDLENGEYLPLVKKLILNQIKLDLNGTNLIEKISMENMLGQLFLKLLNTPLL